MKENRDISALLKAEAESIEVDTEIRPRLRRRIRIHQAAIAGFASVVLIALAGVGIAITGVERELPPVGKEAAGDHGVLARGTENGVPWRMELREGDAGASGDGVCITMAERRRNCFDLPGGERPSVEVGYLRPLGRVVVIVRADPEDSVTIREVGGVNWAALVTNQDAAPSGSAYYYRFLRGKDVEGAISVYRDRPSHFHFNVRVKGKTTQSGFSVARDEFPELRGLGGDKAVVATGTSGGGYSVILRASATRRCLHLNEASKCVQPEEGAGAFGVWVAQLLECSPEDRCGPETKLLVGATETAPYVERIGIRNEDGTSYSSVERSPQGDFATIEVYVRRGQTLELVAFDASGGESESLPLNLDDLRW
jgi:hypothetical protein